MKYAFAVLAALITLYGCGDRIEPGETKGQQAVVSGLQTTVVTRSEAAASRFVSGTVVSVDRAVITARIAGEVARALVREGAAVKPGQPLLELTAETVRAELKATRALVAAKRSQRDEAYLNAELAEKNFARYASLYAKGALTALEYDRTLAEKKAAHEQLAAAESALAAGLAKQEGAETMAGLAILRAPFAATVVEFLVDAGTTVLPGTPLLTLDRSSSWQVRVELPESVAGRYRINDELPLEIPSIALNTRARLAEIVPAADPKTRTVSAKLALDENEGLQGGLYAKVGILPRIEESRVLIPASALVVRGQLTSVYVVEDQILKYRLVRTGPVAAGQVEILSGLLPGEQIVVAGLEKARHGARLETVR